MATAYTTRITNAPLGGSFLSRLLASFTNWNDARKTRNALSRLSDRQLEDIGLNRADIENSIR